MPGKERWRSAEARQLVQMIRKAGGTAVRAGGGKIKVTGPVSQLFDRPPEGAQAHAVLFGHLALTGQHGPGRPLADGDPGLNMISDSDVDVGHPYRVTIPLWNFHDHHTIEQP